MIVGGPSVRARRHPEEGAFRCSGVDPGGVGGGVGRGAKDCGDARIII